MTYSWRGKFQQEGAKSAGLAPRLSGGVLAKGFVGFEMIDNAWVWATDLWSNRRPANTPKVRRLPAKHLDTSISHVGFRFSDPTAEASP